jgi:hypothetical protein
VLRDNLIVVPYGDRPLADNGHLGTVAAGALNRAVRVRTGLPLFVPGVGRQVVAVGANGAPTWRPFARELVWAPNGVSRIQKHSLPARHLKPAAPGQLALDERWVVEVVEAGLWIREYDRVEGAELVRALPVDSQYCTLVLGAFGEHPDRPPWRAIARLLRNLPEDARSRVRLAVPESAGPGMAYGAANALGDLLAGRPMVVFTDEGAMESWHTSLDPSRRY